MGINYSPERVGIGKYTTEMCEHLVGCGHEVTAVTSFPYYPEWRVPIAYRNRFFLTERIKGVTVKRAYLYVPSKVTARTRMLHELSFILFSFLNLLMAGNADVLIAISPPLGIGLVAHLIAEIKRIPFTFHVHDLQPDTAVDLGMIKNGPFVRLLYGIEKFIYRKAAFVSTISETMRRKIIAKGIEPEKVVLFPNWVDTKFIYPMERENVFRKEHGLDGEFLVIYSGNIGVKQGLDVILDVAEKTRDMRDIIYLIVGDGADKERLIRRYNEMSLGNVRFLPVQEPEMLPYLLSAADVSVVPQQKAVTEVVMPSKLTGILASGRPVIAAADRGSEMNEVIAGNRCGLVVEPENAVEMLDALMFLYRNGIAREEFGKTAREYAIKNLPKDAVLAPYEKRIRQTE